MLLMTAPLRLSRADLRRKLRLNQSRYVGKQIARRGAPVHFAEWNCRWVGAKRRPTQCIATGFSHHKELSSETMSKTSRSSDNDGAEINEATARWLTLHPGGRRRSHQYRETFHVEAYCLSRRGLQRAGDHHRDRRAGARRGEDRDGRRRRDV